MSDNQYLPDKANEEWYDQGFDLSADNDQDNSLSAGFSINTSLLKSEAEQFSTGKVLEKSPVSAKIVVDDSMSTISRGASAVPQLRTVSEEVGGQGHAVRSGGSRVYHFDNAGRERASRDYGTNFSYEEGDSEFGTGSRRAVSHGLSVQDAKFLNNLRAQQNEEEKQERAAERIKADFAAQPSGRSSAGIIAVEGTGTRSAVRRKMAGGSDYLGPKRQTSLHGGHTGELMPHRETHEEDVRFDYATALHGSKAGAGAVSGPAREYEPEEPHYAGKDMSSFDYGAALAKDTSVSGYSREYRYDSAKMPASERRFDPNKRSDEHLSSSTGRVAMSERDVNINNDDRPVAPIVRSFGQKQETRSDPTDTNSNKNKSLEELAKEYPHLGTEDLIKLRRSSNRCHLVTRIPVFDSKSNISIYELKFTSGRVFQINALKSQHVYHVLFGYFIRRGISCFIGRGKMAMVMMPITYDLVNYIDRFSVNRLIIRICPEQPVTPSALHLLTSLRRSGMHFAIDMLLLLKKDWNKVVLSIEYVLIDLSAKVKEQLNVFQRLKLKAPWLRSIGYNDVNHEGYALLTKHMIDFLDAAFWSPQLHFNQDVSFFEPAQTQSLKMISELFKEQPDYQIFLHFLSHNESVSRNMAVFMYRFRHVSPRQIQSLQDLFKCLIDNSASRSFSVVIGYSLLQLYCRSASISSQLVLQEFFSQSLIRGYFAEYVAKVFEDEELERTAFQAGMFSLLHLYLLREEVDVLIDESLENIVDSIYGTNEILSDIIDCAKALESVDLAAVFKFIQKYELPPASVLVSYEKGIMRTNELLLVLNLVPFNK